MTPVQHTIEVLGEDGTVDEVDRTTWRSHYGPIIDLPGAAWSEAAAITYRDANIDNDEFLQQYLDTLTATSLDDLQEVNREVNGVPLFNTIAASSDGRAWYADTSATPNLSPEAIAAYEASLLTDPLTKVAADSGAVLLDGSDPMFEWVDEPGARDPGLVPADRQPQLERDDYVFNANDSFWLANPHELLEGDYSPLHGRQDTARSPRTRENAVVLDDASATGASGADGKFTLDELADASLLNEGFTARELRAAVIERCTGVAAPIRVDALPATADAPGLPAAEIDVAPACTVLSSWDGKYDLDRAGAALWRELMARYEPKQLTQAGALWADPFDPVRPVETPSGLAPAPAGAPDPVLINLARATQALAAAGYEPDVALGDAQFALRAGERIPIHGGNSADGTTNVVTFSQSSTSRDPALLDVERKRLVAGSTLSSVDGERGYPVNYGSSFLFAVHFGDDGPTAKAFLTYGNTADRTSDLYTAVTERFSRKEWRDVAFTEAAIERDQIGEAITVRG
jgi:acyl-homoserine-lactone acylase